ncbi:MBL fold metallo-hydrolase [Streptomyces sp. NPDC050504]|uniref:MBL fold metallo-hydrolase n=1 Tax=Streptomyces sp. NPDC050504 TaxID=3365618 RepID=UPI0037AB2B05
MSNHRTTPPSRRLLMRTAAVGVAAPALGAGAATAASAAPAGKRAKAGAASYRWLGTTGWRVDFAGRTVLFDPYVTRFDTGVFSGRFDPATALRTDEALVARHTGSPELIMVSHSHWDHVNDVPFIARSTGAKVIGTETTYHLLRAMGVPAAQLIVVRGGEVLDFDGYVVEAVSSRHSRNKAHAYLLPGTLTAPPAETPRTIGDLPEGDTLAFQLTVGDGPSVFMMGASDFSARELTGLRPDAALVPPPGSSSTYRYTARLMAALDHPGTVVPVHWDNFELPLADGPVRDEGVDLDRFARDVRAASPYSRVIVPDYRTTYRF